MKYFMKVVLIVFGGLLAFMVLIIFLAKPQVNQVEQLKAAKENHYLTNKLSAYAPDFLGRLGRAGYAYGWLQNIEQCSTLVDEKDAELIKFLTSTRDSVFQAHWKDSWFQDHKNDATIDLRRFLSQYGIIHYCYTSIDAWKELQFANWH